MSGLYDEDLPYDEDAPYDEEGGAGGSTVVTGISYSNGFTLGGPPTPPPPPTPISVVRGVPTWHFVLVETDGTPIAELTAAKSKQVTWPINDAASASFTIDGMHPQAALIQELATDLIVYDKAGKKKFRGRLGSSSDAIAASGHVTTFSAVDYRGYFARRLLRDAATTTFTSEDQAAIAWQLIADSDAQTGGTTGITQGVGATTGILRSFTFAQYAKVGDLLNQIANVDNGFDYEFDANLAFNVYYPERGSITGLVLDYEGSVIAVQRGIDTSTFANVVVYTGATGLIPVEVSAGSFGVMGTWEVAIGDTSILDQTTLTIKASYEVAKDDVLVPSNVLTLKSGWWTPEQLWLGDSALVVIKSGRVNDIAVERISQVQLAIGDDGGEVVQLTTGPVSQDQAQQLDAALNRLSVLETLS